MDLFGIRRDVFTDPTESPYPKEEIFTTKSSILMKKHTKEELVCSVSAGLGGGPARLRRMFS